MDSGKNLSDPNLPEAEAEKILGAFIKRREDNKLKETWSQKLAAEHGVARDKAPGSSKPLIGRTLYYALALAAALAFLVFALPLLQAKDGDQLLASAIEKTELVTTRAASGSAADDLRAQITRAFDQQQYGEALKKSKELNALPQATDDDAFSLGLIHLRAGNYDLAITALADFRQTDTPYYTEATYYTGLAQLGEGEIEQGLAILRTIEENSGGRYFKAAQKLLEADWDETTQR